MYKFPGPWMVYALRMCCITHCRPFLVGACRECVLATAAIYLDSIGVYLDQGFWKLENTYFEKDENE